MATTPTRTPVIDATVDGTILTLAFSNSEVLTINADSLSDEIRTAAMMHGLKQKLVDAAAIARNPDTGRSATPDDKYNAVREVYDRITQSDGTWNKGRTGEGSGAGNGLLLSALMELRGLPREKVEAYLADKTKEQKAALRDNAKVAPIIARLKAARSKVNSDDLLGELE